MHVLDLEHGCPACRGVAGLADVGGLDVIGVLARRRRAVVTGEAIVGYARMVENPGLPGRRGVAIVTLIAGRQVIGGFAARVGAVVTGAAAARDVGMVHERDRRPCRRRMAVVAGIRRGQVIHRLGGGEHGTVLGVAADAVDGRTLERAVGVASVAGHVGVRAVQVETRTEVVERHLSVRRRGQEEQQDQQLP